VLYGWFVFVVVFTHDIWSSVLVSNLGGPKGHLFHMTNIQLLKISFSIL